MIKVKRVKEGDKVFVFVFLYKGLIVRRSSIGETSVRKNSSNNLVEIDEIEISESLGAYLDAFESLLDLEYRLISVIAPVIKQELSQFLLG